VEFSAEMERDYQLYKGVAERREMIVDGFTKALKGFGGLGLMTEREQKDARALWGYYRPAGQRNTA
jgi:hypothetical protein